MNPKATSDSSLCEISSNAKTMVILLAPLMMRSVGLSESCCFCLDVAYDSTMLLCRLDVCR